MGVVLAEMLAASTSAYRSMMFCPVVNARSDRNRMIVRDIVASMAVVSKEVSHHRYEMPMFWRCQYVFSPFSGSGGPHGAGRSTGLLPAAGSKAIFHGSVASRRPRKRFFAKHGERGGRMACRISTSAEYAVRVRWEEAVGVVGEVGSARRG